MAHLDTTGGISRRTALAGLAGAVLAPHARASDPGFEVIHEFDGTDGHMPNGSLVQAADGRLWGTTQGGGARGGGGVVFSLSLHGRVRVMHSFPIRHACAPAAGLVVGPDELLYGTTSGGGNDVSTLFRTDLQGGVTVLHRFTIGGETGFNPTTELVATADGSLFGTAREAERSIAFTLPSGGEAKRLHYFIPDEGSSTSTLVQAEDGAFYGVASYLGSKHGGTAFRMTPEGAVTVLYAFGLNKAHGPNSLMRASDGSFYGTTVFGGAAGMGTVFRMTAEGVVTVVHEFDRSNGARPSGRLVQASNGLLYGVTQGGGEQDVGVLYRLSADGSRYRVLHHFIKDGSENPTPCGALLQASDGRLYGSTLWGGPLGKGVLYRVKPV